MFSWAHKPTTASQILDWGVSKLPHMTFPRHVLSCPLPFSVITKHWNSLLTAGAAEAFICLGRYLSPGSVTAPAEDEKAADEMFLEVPALCSRGSLKFCHCCCMSWSFVFPLLFIFLVSSPCLKPEIVSRTCDPSYFKIVFCFLSYFLITSSKHNQSGKGQLRFPALWEKSGCLCFCDVWGILSAPHLGGTGVKALLSF